MKWTLLLLLLGAIQLATAQANNPSTMDRADLLRFDFPDLNGKRVRLADFHGQPLVLDIWATWCPPCRGELASLTEVQRKLGPRGLRVIAISIDEVGDKAVAQAAADAHVNYPIVFATDEFNSAWNWEGLPVTLFIGRDGKVHRRLLGASTAEELYRNAEELLESK